MDHLPLFSTHVFVFENPDNDQLNQALAAALLAEREVHPGIVQSNIGGWHSTPDLSQRRSSVFGALMQGTVNHVRKCCETLAGTPDLPPYEYRVQGWGMVMEDGHYTIAHDHSASHWSVVYYVDVGDADTTQTPQSGTLSFLDPRRGQLTVPGLPPDPTTFNISPQNGMMVIFPGWLQHYVHPYRGSRPRISIACNIDVMAQTQRQG